MNQQTPSRNYASDYARGGVQCGEPGGDVRSRVKRKKFITDEFSTIAATKFVFTFQISEL